MFSQPWQTKTAGVFEKWSNAAMVSTALSPWMMSTGAVTVRKSSTTGIVRASSWRAASPSSVA
jgi:hypothetical protein